MIGDRRLPDLDELRSSVRFGKFVSVGAVGATFDVTVLLLLTELANVSPAIAGIVGIETSILVMFTVNEHWTFAEEGSEDTRSLGGRFLRSHMVRAFGATLHYALFVGVYYGVAVTLTYAGLDLWLLLVKGGALATTLVVNYVFESLFTWRVHRGASGEN